MNPPKEIKDLILKEVSLMPEAVRKGLSLGSDFEVYQPHGCSKCNFEGFFGMTGVFELLAMTPALAELILKEPSEAEISKEAFRQGMTTIRQDGILKVLEGVTTFEEVERVSEEQ